jgi:fibronectin type 3 domain-containing protein
MRQRGGEAMGIMFKLTLLAVGCIMLLGSLCAPVFATTDITLSWDTNTEPDLTGYRVYQSAVSSVYSKTTGKVCDVAKTSTTCVITALPDGTYFWVATAYDGNGNESPFSNEVSVKLDTTPPSSPKNLKQVSVKVTVNMRNGMPYIVATATTGN